MKFPSLKHPALRPDDLEPTCNTSAQLKPDSTLKQRNRNKKVKNWENYTVSTSKRNETKPVASQTILEILHSRCNNRHIEQLTEVFGVSCRGLCVEEFSGVYQQALAGDHP